MAGHVRYTALLDACVLYPLAMTDALMSLATAGLYAAKVVKSNGAPRGRSDCSRLIRSCREFLSIIEKKDKI